MDWLGEFQQRQTLARLSEQLSEEMRPGERDILHAKVLREEDKIGKLQERLEQLDNFILQRRQRIRLQSSIVDHLVPAADETGTAAAVLEELIRTQELFERERTRVASGLGGNF